MEKDQCEKILEHLMQVHKDQEAHQTKLIDNNTNLISRSFWMLLGVAVLGEAGMIGSLFMQQNQMDKLREQLDRGGRLERPFEPEQREDTR